MSLLAYLSGIGGRTLRSSLIVTSVVLLAACGSTSVTSTGPSPVKCLVTLTSPDAPVVSSASVGTITVSTTPECAWTVTSDADWVALNPSSGQGSGSVQVGVAANSSPIARQADIVVNGAHARIQQEPAPCVYVLSESSATVGASGGIYHVTVSTAAGCTWTASSGTTWISVAAGASGSGAGQVDFSVQANVGSARTGNVTIAGQSFSFVQNGPGAPPAGGSAPTSGCTYIVSSLAQSIPAAGGSGSLTLTTACAWSVTSDATWITIQSPASGTGNATIAFSVAGNSGAGRHGTITIGTATVSIDQAAATNCVATVTPMTITAPVGGSTGVSISVSVAAACSWTATSTASWITITGGASGTGSGNVIFRTTANDGDSRSGTIQVAGKTVTVTQPAACSFVVNPLTVPVGSAAITGQSLTITTATGCAWTAASNASWITVTSGASGNGSGTVRFDIGANNGAPRTGTLTAAGQTVTVSQSSGCSYTLSQGTVSIVAAAGAGPAITVSAASGCGWTASSGANWLTITSGASGSGNGTVNFSALQNTGPARSGSLSIAGQTVTINQASGCLYTVTVVPTSFRDEGGTGTGTVTTVSGCSWTASSASDWIVVQSGANGSGSGTVTLQIQANPGAKRTGTVTIAGHSFDIQQSNK